ncbi:unnamed protein product [Blepharisma stoltei]|uniref:Uncharacterized protein n=1 Tax=Blepharisma stoltei TaxID=1481888 RepID=A0AAU9K927_9CILI|nr:unnamed protein product [Blepharisma stoltei]
MDKLAARKSLTSIKTPKKTFFKNQQRLEMIISAYAPSSIHLPSIRKSERSPTKKRTAKLTIQKPNLVKLMKEEPLPPWMQDIGIRTFPDDKLSMLQYDLLSQKQKLTIKNMCNPDKVKSKVKTVFRASEIEAKDKKLKNVFRRIRKMDTNKFEKEMLKLKSVNSDPDFHIFNIEDDINEENALSARNHEHKDFEPQNLPNISAGL